MTFFLRFFLRNVKSSRKRWSDGVTTYPCSSLSDPLQVCSMLMNPDSRF